MVTRTKKVVEDPAVIANFGRYPENYYTTPETGFLPRAKFMKDEARAQISRDISTSTAASVAMLEASAAGQPPGPPPPPVAGGGGSGDNGGMEARIQSLETDMKDVRERLVRVEVKIDAIDKRMDGLDSRMDRLDSRMDRLEKKVDDLPSKDFVDSKVSASANRIIVWVVGALVLTQIIPKVPDLLKVLIP